MTEVRPYLQIPLLSPEEEQYLYEEWLKKQEETIKEEPPRVIILDI
jgi:hypothetical protein